MRFVIVALCAAMTVTLISFGSYQAGDKKDPKYTIKEVMKKAHKGKGSLLNKVASGKASKEEKEQLVELYVALCQNTPKKGEKEAWVKRCTSMVELAKAAAGGKEVGKKLKKAASCGGCHKLHKG